MKTIVLETPGQFTVTETDAPVAPGPGEALVRVRRVGICGTDLHAFRGQQPFFTYPRILGHELGVEVVALGEGVSNLRVGDRCAVEPYLNCGTCVACRRGKSNCCTSMNVIGVHSDGGMRELICVPAPKLHPSNSLSLEHLALVEMLCIGAHAVWRAAMTAGDTALVVGLGPIGLTVAAFAKLAGVEVIAMDINPDRLSFARENLNLTHTVDARVEVLPQLQALTHNDLPLHVFEVTGNQKAMEQSFSYVAHGGQLIFVGLVKADLSFHDPWFHSHEMTLLSSRNATAADFRYVIETLEAGQINLAPWITHRVPAGEIVAAFPTWLDPASGTIKAMLDF